MIKYLKYIIPLLFIFIGFNVNAKGTMFIGNGTVLNQCTGTTCGYPTGGTTNIRFIGDSTNFEVDHKYTFKLNFSAQTSLASPTLSDCGLNINGAYVSPESRNSGRVNFECNSGYTRCDSNYVSTIIYTMPSSLTSVPYFIQCDMTPSSTTYTYTNFTMSISDSNGSVIQALDNNTDRMIEINNYNANQNNKNRDTNTTKITDKIQDFMDSVGNGISNIISNLTTLGSNIVSGIGNAINTAKNALISAMDGLQMGINAVISAIGDIVSPIVNAIGTGVSNIVNKIGEMIGTQEVCTIDYYVNGTTSNFSYVSGKQLNVNTGDLDDSQSYFLVSDFLPLSFESSNSNIVYTSTSNFGVSRAWNICFYRNDKSLISCSAFNGNGNSSFTVNRYASYVRFDSYFTGNGRFQLRGACQKTGIAGLFNKFTSFVSNFFSNVLGLERIGSVLDRHKGILENSAFDGIASVINAPRQLLQSMNSYSCSNITTSVFNHNITLPSGCFFWERQDVSSFRAFWNLLFGGFLIYKFAYRLFKVLNDSLDPTKDDIGGLEV